MKKVTLFILTAIVALLLAACGGADEKPAANKAANTSTVANLPAPTKDALVALDTKAYEAWKNKDGKFFEDYLTEGYVSLNQDGRRDKATTIKGITESNCDAKSLSVSEEQITSLGADAALLTYKASGEFTCDGEDEQSTVWAATVFVRKGEQWKSAYRNEVPIIDPKSAPANPASATKPAADETKPAADAKPADPLTEALLAAEKQGWEGWKNRDTKGIEEVITKDLVFIDPTGRFDKAGALKAWTEPKCEIKSFAFSDAASVSLTEDIGLLTLKGTADGKCEGQPLTPLWNTSVFVKDGETWKLAFILETPA